MDRGADGLAQRARDPPPGARARDGVGGPGPGATDDGAVVWCLVDVGADGPVGPCRCPAWTAPGGSAGSRWRRSRCGTDRQLRDLAPAVGCRTVAVALMAAEHAGGARWCLETATEYAKVRVQFGRPIGQFQAVKHRLADMAVRVEQMAAVAWDAAVAVDAVWGDGDGGAGALDDGGHGATAAAWPSTAM